MVADFDKKQNSKFFNKNLLFKTISILFLVVAVLLAFTDFKIYQKKQEINSQISSFQKQIESIKKSSQTLKDEIANAGNPDYLEKIAYEQLNQQKPGEKEIIFVTPPEKPKAPARAQNFWDNFAGWLSQSWNWIKMKF